MRFAVSQWDVAFKGFLNHFTDQKYKTNFCLKATEEQNQRQLNKSWKNETALDNVTVIWTDEAQFLLICFWRLQTQIVLIFYTLYTKRSNLGVCHCIVIEMYSMRNISYFAH